MTVDSPSAFKSYLSLAVPIDYHDALHNRFDLELSAYSQTNYLSKLLVANGLHQDQAEADRALHNQLRNKEIARINRLKNYYFNKLNINSSNNDVKAYMEHQRIWQPLVSLAPFEKIISNVNIHGPSAIMEPDSFANDFNNEFGDSDSTEALSADDPLQPPSIPPPMPPKYQNFDLNNIRPKPSFNGATGATGSKSSKSSTGNAVADAIFDINNPATQRQHKEYNRLTREEFKNNFISFTYCPTVYGKKKLPTLLHHASVALEDRIFTLGGVRLVLADNGKPYDISNLKVKGPEFPFPLKDQIFNNPALVPNPDLFVLDNETNILQNPVCSGDVPPPLCCASATLLTDRYIFYYGGFEVRTRLSEVDSSTAETDNIYIERDFAVNGRGWILDTVGFKFKEINLQPDPNASLKVPIKLERFGHTAVASELTIISMVNKITSQLNFLDIQTELPKGLAAAEHGHEGNEYNIGISGGNSSNNSTASVFVFGGYSYNTQTNKFSCSNYHWKIDLKFANDGTNNILQFEDTAHYSCLQSVNEGPAPRGFHAALLVNDEILATSESIASNLSSRTSRTNLSNLSNNSSSLNTAYQTKGRTMLVQGGTNQSTIFGDLWKYSFAAKSWELVKVYSNKYTKDCAPTGQLFESQLYKANHQMVMLDKYLLFTGGFGPRFVHDELVAARRKHGNFSAQEDLNGDDPSNANGFGNSSSLPDAQDTAEELVQNMHRSYQRLILLDTQTNTWIFAKVSHNMGAYLDFEDIFFPEKPSKAVSSGAAGIQEVKRAVERGNELQLRKIMKSEGIFVDTTDSSASADDNAAATNTNHPTADKIQMIQKLLFAVRTNGLFTGHMNLLGSTACFANGKVCTVGGILLCDYKERHRIEKAKLSDSLSQRKSNSTGTTKNSNQVSEKGQEEVPVVELLKVGFPLGTVVNLEMPIFAQGFATKHVNEQKFLLTKR